MLYVVQSDILLELIKNFFFPKVHKLCFMIAVETPLIQMKYSYFSHLQAFESEGTR